MVQVEVGGMLEIIKVIILSDFCEILDKFQKCIYYNVFMI